MFIDTHTHLFSDQFDEDRTQIVKNAIAKGVTKMLLPNIDLETINAMHQLESEFPENCYSMMGLHPSSVTKNWEEQLSVIKSHLDQRNYVAVGEIGIDLYWDKTLIKEQTAAFEQQVVWAKELGLPIVIHARESFDEIFEVIDRQNDERLTGIFHCFTGNETQAQKIIDYGGFKMGIGGVVTFKKAGLDKTLASVDPKHLVLETDSPYLAPTPNRGKRNESSYIPLIADKLSDIYEMSIEEIGRITTENANEVFNLNQSK